MYCKHNAVKQLFMIKISCLKEKKHSVIVKFKILKSFKRRIKSRNNLPSVNLSLRCSFSEVAVHIHRFFSKQAFLKISQYSQENTCAGPYRLSFTEQLRRLLLDFRVSKCFYFSWTLYLLLTVAPVFAPNFFENTS